MDFSERNHHIDRFSDFYFLYVVFPVFYLIGTYHIYLKQRTSLKPQVTLIIIALIDLSLSSIGLGIYIFFLRADLGNNSGVMRSLKCFITLLAFFKSLDNILGQVDSFLAIWKPHKYTKVNGDKKKFKIQSLKFSGDNKQENSGFHFSLETFIRISNNSDRKIFHFEYAILFIMIIILIKNLII